MKRFLKQSLALGLLLIVLGACAAEKEEPLYYEDGIVNLHGPWGENQKAYEGDKAAAMAIRTSHETALPAEKEEK